VHTHTITNTYNATDWQTDTTSDGLLTRYGYDAAGQQRTHTIVDGTTLVTSTLDAEGRTTAIAEKMGVSFQDTWAGCTPGAGYFVTLIGPLLSG